MAGGENGLPKQFGIGYGAGTRHCILGLSKSLANPLNDIGILVALVTQGSGGAIGFQG